MIDRGLTLERALEEVGTPQKVETRSISSYCTVTQIREMQDRLAAGGLMIRRHAWFRDTENTIWKSVISRQLSLGESMWADEMDKLGISGVSLEHGFAMHCAGVLKLDSAELHHYADEWIGNALEYGLATRPGMLVRIAMVLGDDAFLLSIEDPGDGIGMGKLTSLDNEPQPVCSQKEINDSRGMGWNRALNNSFGDEGCVRVGFEKLHPQGFRVNLLFQRNRPPDLLKENTRMRAGQVIAVNNHLPVLPESSRGITSVINGAYSRAGVIGLEVLKDNILFYFKRVVRDTLVEGGDPDIDLSILKTLSESHWEQLANIYFHSRVDEIERRPWKDDVAIFAVVKLLQHAQDQPITIDELQKHLELSDEWECIFDLFDPEGEEFLHTPSRIEREGTKVRLRYVPHPSWDCSYLYEAVADKYPLKTQERLSK